MVSGLMLSGIMGIHGRQNVEMVISALCSGQGPFEMYGLCSERIAVLAPLKRPKLLNFEDAGRSQADVSMMITEGRDQTFPLPQIL